VGKAYAGGGPSSGIRKPADGRRVFVELTERGKSLEDRAACLGPAVFGDIPIFIGRGAAATKGLPRGHG
jgi:DNA-binding MarR family transcriptional regulator